MFAALRFFKWIRTILLVGHQLENVAVEIKNKISWIIWITLVLTAVACPSSNGPNERLNYLVENLSWLGISLYVIIVNTIDYRGSQSA